MENSHTEFLEAELRKSLEINKHKDKIINANNENFKKVISMYDELNTKYKAILNIKTDLEIYVNSVDDDIKEILNDDDLSRADERELEVLQNVKNSLNNILNKNQNKNTEKLQEFENILRDNGFEALALEEIKAEMSNPQAQEKTQSQVRKNR